MAQKIAYFDCFSGISGDMCLGALVDAGVPLDALRAELGKLSLAGWSISASRVKRHSIAATLVAVDLQAGEHRHDHEDDHEHEHHHAHEHEHGHEHGHHSHDGHGPHPRRRLSDIIEIIDGSGLDRPIGERAKRIFERLAEAEGTAHDVPKEDIHFHEVGAVDAIIDVVGTCVALSLLGVDTVVASPLPMSRGFVKCAHGLMPIPVPGTLALLAGVPVEATDLVGELVTPTGAAIITTLADEFGPMPDMVIQASGYGAGQRDSPERPNMLRVVLGTARSEAGSGIQTDRIAIIETNIDDQSPEVFGYVADRLFAQGALDVYYTPIFMKKGRPAYQLTVLADLDNVEAVTGVILSETSTFGVRVSEARRRKLAREMRTVTTPYGDVRIKVGASGTTVKAAAEYDDCRACAESAGVPIRVVYDAAIDAFRAASRTHHDT